MNNKIVAVAIVLVLVLAGAIVIIPESEITWDALKENDPIAYERAKAVSSSEYVTIEDAANFTLYKCGLSDDIAGKTQFDRRSMSSYSGIMNNINRGYSDHATRTDLNVMLSNATGLKNAYSSGVPYFYNGLSLPIFSYTDGTYIDYSNADSNIIRYCVYVETEYDTDSDGKRDLVKVFLQIPRSAFTGSYKAPVILECNPYGVGMIDEEMLEIEAADSYDLSKLYSQPAARTPSGSVDSATMASSAKLSDWLTDDFGYSSLNSFDYYLIRGYAVAICCGLGSYGSEGFACTGTDIELSAYKKVVEWFDGKATAFSDTTGCKTTEAEWSNGNVGTYGISYLGTIQIGLAAMGIPNLKTAVPLGAISDWYEYSYCQGAPINSGIQYNYWLTGFVSSNYLFSGFSDEYKDYLSKLRYDESLMKGNYYTGDYKFWSSRDYRNMELHPGTSMLLIEGLNEDNVKTKQFEMAYSMFTDAGYTVKAILHQGLHQELTGRIISKDITVLKNSTMDADGQLFYEVLNEWYTCYLFEVDNDAEDISNVWIQSNIDGSWSYRDDFDSESTLSLTSSKSGTNTITRSGYDADPIFKTVSDAGRSVVTFNVENDTTLCGIPKVTVKASTSDVIDYATMTVALYDVCDDGVDSCLNIHSKPRENLSEPTGDKIWFGGGFANGDITRFYDSERTYQLITRSSVNMNNPSSNYESKTAVPETIEEDMYYEYSLYLNPTAYTIQEGHTLAVIIYTLDPNNEDYKDMDPGYYSLTIDESSITVSVGTI